MSLNFEQIGKPVAKVCDKNNTRTTKTVYLADDEFDDEPINKFNKIELKQHQYFEPVCVNSERDILYITGASGSGKSYYASSYIKNYIKKNPRHEVFLFSSIDEDKALDDIKQIKRFDINHPEFLEEEFHITDFRNSLVIFDDTDCMTNKKILKQVNLILDIVLQTGRKYACSCIYTSHSACNGSATKLILNESHSITFFINGMGGKAIHYLLDNYLGLSKQQIIKVKDIPSRSTTIIKTFPQLIMTQKMICFTKHL